MTATMRARALMTLIVVLLAGLATAGCSASVSAGKRTVSVSAIEKDAQAKLIKAAGQQPGSASLDCPGKTVEAKKGVQLACTLTVAADGSQLATTVTLTDDKGHFDAKVEGASAK